MYKYSSDHYLLLMKMSMGCKVQKGEKKAENVAIRTDRLKDRGENEVPSETVSEDE